MPLFGRDFGMGVSKIIVYLLKKDSVFLQIMSSIRQCCILELMLSDQKNSCELFLVTRSLDLMSARNPQRCTNCHQIPFYVVIPRPLLFSTYLLLDVIDCLCKLLLVLLSVVKCDSLVHSIFYLTNHLKQRRLVRYKEQFGQKNICTVLSETDLDFEPLLKWDK